MDEILDLTLLVAETLERLGIPYLVGGSLASSLHGIPRSTQDADVVVRIGAEDVAAHKLYWYALGDEVSERQWSDAVGVLKVGGARLDAAYLRRIARLRGVEALLRRACDEAGVSLG